MPGERCESGSVLGSDIAGSGGDVESVQRNMQESQDICTGRGRSPWTVTYTGTHGPKERGEGTW